MELHILERAFELAKAGAEIQDEINRKTKALIEKDGFDGSLASQGRRLSRSRGLRCLNT